MRALRRASPLLSAPLPSRKPGRSIRYTSGSPNASHTDTKCAAFSHAGESSVPADCIGWFAITPTGRPSKRAKQVTRFFAYVGLSSNALPRSTIAATTLRTSYARRGFSGITVSSDSSARCGGSSHGVTGAGCAAHDGRNDSQRRIVASASSSDSAAMSASP